MNVSWVFAATYTLDPLYDVEQIKKVGPSWGSWKSWRSCATDNVICHDSKKAHDLVQRNFQNSCNFYIPGKYFSEIGRPAGVRLYDGDFRESVNDIEDIIALHFASAESDIVLLAGFDFGTVTVPTDKLAAIKLRNQHGLMRTILAARPDIQWVAINHSADLDPAYKTIENLTCDTMENVLQLLTQVT